MRALLDKRAGAINDRSVGLGPISVQVVPFARRGEPGALIVCAPPASAEGSTTMSVTDTKADPVQEALDKALSAMSKSLKHLRVAVTALKEARE